MQSKWSIIIPIALIFTLLGLGGLLLLSTPSIQRYIKGQMTVAIEVDGLPKAKEVEALLLQRSEIVPESIHILSKEEAFEDMKSQVLRGVSLTDNPLSDMVTFQVTPDSYSDDFFNELKHNITEVPNAALYYESDQTKSIGSLLTKTAWTLLLVGMVLLVLGVQIIKGVIRLWLSKEADQISTLITIGSKPDYVRKPYVAQAITIGVNAAAIAAVLVGICWMYMLVAFKGFATAWTVIGGLLMILILFAIGIGLFAYVSFGVLNAYIRAAYAK